CKPRRSHHTIWRAPRARNADAPVHAARDRLAGRRPPLARGCGELGMTAVAGGIERVPPARCNPSIVSRQIKPAIFPPLVVVSPGDRVPPMGHTCWPAAGGAAVKAEAVIICVLLLLLPAAAAQQAPTAEGAAAIDAEADGNGTTRGGGGGGGRGGGGRGGGDGARSKLVSSIDCQICEATCRVKCLINNLFQWGVCYQRCKSDNCNDWCR
uniref:Uncharacterized protein n=1 Tax=Setaria italica TaxID=4555 RepID=K4ALK3_SETIT